MRRFIVGLLAAASIAAAAPATGAADSTNSPTVHAACTYHRIAGQRKCIAVGQFCKHTRRANRDYHKYGYHCGKRDRNGRYHLVYY